MKDAPKISTESNWAFKALLAAGLVVVAGVVVLLLNFAAVPDSATGRWEQLGQRGDFIGGHLSAFANFAALIFLGSALFAQMSELKVTRLDSERTRKEFETQSEIFSEQKRLQLRQVQENFLLTFLATLAPIERQIIRLDKASNHHGWSLVQTAVGNKSDAKQFLSSKHVDAWGCVTNYLRAVDFISTWAYRDDHATLRESYLELISVHLPATFSSDLDVMVTGGVDFSSLPGLRMYLGWSSEKRRQKQRL